MSVMLKITHTVLFVLFILSVSFVWADGDKHTKKVKKMERAHWTAPLEERNRINPVDDTIESIQRGHNLYIANCADCHGPKAEGDGPTAKYLDTKPSNLKAMAGHHPDGGMAWKIKNGKGDMPAWEDILTEQQIWDLVTFIQNLKKAD